MAKFEVEMELQGFKLRVKAERESDIPRITGQLGQQLAGILSPPPEILEAPPHIESAPRRLDATNDNGQETDRSKGRRGARRRTASPTETSAPQPLNWRHDPKKWGMPRQSWTAGQKILWTLYVIDKEVDQKEVSGPVIAETFNSAFRQFGPLKKQNMPRDLGILKKKTPAQVMDNTTMSPITWYLTEEGIKEAEKLFVDARSVPPEESEGV